MALATVNKKGDKRYEVYFDKFGVNVYEENTLIRRKIFKSLNDAIEFSKNMGSVGYTCKFVTVDKVGCIIDEL